jgi:hypothetical protein
MELKEISDAGKRISDIILANIQNEISKNTKEISEKAENLRLTINNHTEVNIENINQAIQNNNIIAELIEWKKGIESRTEIKKLIKNEYENIDTEKFRYINILVAIFILSFLFMLGMVMIQKMGIFEFSVNSIILAFIGIATTFVVVSNYAQVKDIENKFETKVDYIENKQITIEKYQEFTDQYTMGVYDHFRASSLIRDKQVPICQIYSLFVSSAFHFLKAYETNVIQNKESLLNNISTDVDGLQECLRHVNNDDNLLELLNNDAFLSKRSYISNSKTREFSKLKDKFNKIDNLRKKQQTTIETSS